MFLISVFFALIFSMSLQAQERVKVPIIHPKGYGYNYFEALVDNPIKAWFLGFLHPFDPKKPGKVRDALADSLFISFYNQEDLGSYIQKLKAPFKNDNELFTWVEKSLKDNGVVTDDYWDSLHQKPYKTILSVVETDAVTVKSELVHNFGINNNWAHNLAIILQNKILDLDLNEYLLKPMKRATAGTALAMYLATDSKLQDENGFGWAINLSGGYHHAKADEGSGGCAFSDIALATKLFWKKSGNQDKKVLIIDLDAHNGNGYATIFMNDKRVIVFDVYNSSLTPININEEKYMGDTDAQKAIQYGYPIPGNTSSEKYIRLIQDELPFVLNEEKPALIIYNAGTDPHEGDEEGRMHITTEDMIKRDLLVFEEAKHCNVPIIMMPSGGYQLSNAETISESIETLLKIPLKDTIDEKAFKEEEGFFGWIRSFF